MIYSIEVFVAESKNTVGASRKMCIETPCTVTKNVTDNEIESCSKALERNVRDLVKSALREYGKGCESEECDG